MSRVQEIEAAIPRLSRAEIEELRTWFEEYLEDQFEMTDEVKVRLDQSHREMANGQSTARQHRSVLHIRSLPGKWIGETVIKGSDLADEMFARE